MQVNVGTVLSVYIVIDDFVIVKISNSVVGINYYAIIFVASYGANLNRKYQIADTVHKITRNIHFKIIISLSGQGKTSFC